MDMETARSLMEEAKTGFLATTDGSRPSVRPMGGWKWVNDELWLATGRDSAKVADIEATGRAEICFMVPDFRHVRIAGPCRISTDQADKSRLFEMLPILANYMDGPEDPKFVVLRLEPDSIRVMGGDDMAYEEVLGGEGG